MTQAKTYKAPHAVYTGGRLYAPLEPFTTAEKKGADWDEVGKAEKAATEAADPTLQNDPPLEKLGLDALRAIAFDKDIDSTGLSKNDLVTAIKAANEPRL